MDPFVVYLTVVIAGLAGFTAWLVKAYLAHLEGDIAYSRKAAGRGTELAEKAADALEQKA